jgi:predicted nucleotidyltransferase
MKELPAISQELSELIAFFTSRKVEFIVSGAHAMAAYSQPRYTEDLDLFVRRQRDNLLRLQLALRDFGLEITDDGVEEFLAGPRSMMRIGSPPSQVDILNFLSGLKFEEAMGNAGKAKLGGVEVSILSLEDLKTTKRAAGRPKDLEDLRRLEEESSGA